MQKIKKSKKFISAAVIILFLIIAAEAADSLVPVGHTAGIKLRASGAMVVGFSEELKKNPAKESGILVGDVVKTVNGTPVASNTELRNAVEKSDEAPAQIELERNGKTEKVTVNPVKGEDGSLRIGVWVRDSIAGIGTITYYNPEDHSYAALGHGISDSEAEVLIPVDSGELIKSSVRDVVKGEPGTPGELCGKYSADSGFADISKNTNCGIYGKITDGSTFEGMKAYPIADRSEIKRGRASILSNIEGDEVREYGIEITSIYFDGEPTKNMMIRVTDPELLSRTGGIVRGMSGSPILQNGKLIGAVTHVLVNNPQKGYAIFIENMQKEANKTK